MTDDLQNRDVDKTFRLAALVYDAWRGAFFAQKGDQLVEASASLLMYLQASEEERQECREMVDRLRRRLVTIEEIQSAQAGLSLNETVVQLQDQVARLADQIRVLSDQSATPGRSKKKKKGATAKRIRQADVPRKRGGGRRN